MKPAMTAELLATDTSRLSATLGSNGSSRRMPEPEAKPASASRPIGIAGLNGTA